MLLSKKYAHLEALVSKHADLERHLVEAYQHYADDTAVKTLKLEKLRVKEEITQLKQEIAQYADRKA